MFNFWEGIHLLVLGSGKNQLPAPHPAGLFYQGLETSEVALRDVERARDNEDREKEDFELPLFGRKNGRAKQGLPSQKLTCPLTRDHFKWK